MPFIVTPKKMKYLGISLTKHIQDMCNENYKVLMKNIKEELKKHNCTSTITKT